MPTEAQLKARRRFTKMIARAKAIHKKHPSKPWKECIKAASKKEAK